MNRNELTRQYKSMNGKHYQNLMNDTPERKSGANGSEDCSQVSSLRPFWA